MLEGGLICMIHWVDVDEGQKAFLDETLCAGLLSII